MALIATAGTCAGTMLPSLGSGTTVLAFAGEATRFPVAEREFAHARPGADTHGTTILLCAIEPVGKAIVGGEMVDLRGGLVVLGAPGLRAIDADHGPLVAREHHALRVSRVDPDLVIVIAAGSAFDGSPGLAASVVR